MILLVHGRVSEIRPSGGDDDVVHVGSHEHNARGWAPCTAEPHEAVAHNGAIDKHKARVVLRSPPCLRCDGPGCLGYDMNLTTLSQPPSHALGPGISDGVLFLLKNKGPVKGGIQSNVTNHKFLKAF